MNSKWDLEKNKGVFPSIFYGLGNKKQKQKQNKTFSLASWNSIAIPNSYGVYGLKNLLWYLKSVVAKIVYRLL